MSDVEEENNGVQGQMWSAAAAGTSVSLPSNPTASYEDDQSDAGFSSAPYYPEASGGHNLRDLGAPPSNDGQFAPDDWSGWGSSQQCNAATRGGQFDENSPLPPGDGQGVRAGTDGTLLPGEGPTSDSPLLPGEGQGVRAADGTPAAGRSSMMSAVRAASPIATRSMPAVTFHHDAHGNLTSLTDPVGNTTSWAYEQWSPLPPGEGQGEGGSLYRVTSETDALGHSRHFSYDSAGNLSRFADRNGQIRQFQYAGGNRASETWYATADDANNADNSLNTIQYVYDSAGRITSESDDNTADSYTYDDAGHILSTTESSVGGPTVTLAYQYNPAGHRTQMAAVVDGTADFVDDYAYNSLGQVTSVHQHAAASPLPPGEGQVEGCDAVADITVDLAYNNTGQIQSIERFEGTQLVVTGSYSYDSLGRLVGLVYHQGGTILNSYAWTYSGTGSPRLSGEGQGVRAEGASTWLPTGGLMPIYDTTGVTDALMSGGLAGVDLLTSCTSIDGTASYSYDPTGQLIGAQYTSPLPPGEGQGEGAGVQPDESYSYDANGNRILANGSTYATGTDNRLLSDGTYTYSYDAEGNRTAKFIDANNDGVLDAGDTNVAEYTWDARNRLVKVTDYATEGGSPTQIVDYLYDVENRWVGEDIRINGTEHQIRFAYDGNQIVLQFEKDGEGAVTGADLSHRYLWQPKAVDQLMADERTHLDGNNQIVSDEVLWALTDQQGTVHDLAKRDGATGVTAVVDHITRDSFGKVISESDPSQGSLIGWTGRPVDKTTGQQNNLNRWYDPIVAGWMSQDPKGFAAGQTNLYVYCGNSPVTGCDPSGLAPDGLLDLGPATDPWIEKGFLDMEQSVRQSAPTVYLDGLGLVTISQDLSREIKYDIDHSTPAWLQPFLENPGLYTPSPGGTAIGVTGSLKPEDEKRGRWDIGGDKWNVDLHISIPTSPPPKKSPP